MSSSNTIYSMIKIINMKWNVNAALCFLDLQRKNVVKILKLRYNQYDRGGRLC